MILSEASARQSPNQTVIFELSRINLWAVAVAYWAYEWALKEGVGIPFSLSGAS